MPNIYIFSLLVAVCTTLHLQLGNEVKLIFKLRTSQAGKWTQRQAPPLSMNNHTERFRRAVRTKDI